MFDRLRAWLAENRHAYILPIAMVAYLLLFFGLDFFGREPEYILHSRLDDMIPFNEWFAIPYFLWFAVFPLSLLAFLLLDKEDFLELSFVVFVGAAFSFAAYVLLPNGLELRPEVLPRENLLSSLMQLIWLIDSPNNVCPSLHVSISTAVALVTLRSRKLAGRWCLKSAVVLLMALICVSTLFVKQHSAWDLLAGVVLSVLLFLFWEVRRKRAGI